MINDFFKGLNMEIPVIIPMKRRGCINQGVWAMKAERLAPQGFEERRRPY